MLNLKENVPWLIFFFGQSLVRKVTILLNKINIITYFENLIVKLYVFYILNAHIKFCVNWILFAI